MPLFDLTCKHCGNTEERYIGVAWKALPICRGCGGKLTKLPPRPNVVNWKPDRAFPNLSKEGDGSMTFPTKQHYEQFLRRNNLGELGVQSKVTPHTAKVV